MVTDEVGDVWGCGEAVSRSMEIQWVGVGFWMFFRELGPRKQAPPERNPDTHISRSSQRQGSGGRIWSEGYLGVWGKDAPGYLWLQWM